MSQKFSTQRKRAFLAYLAQTGNQTLAAERARVSRSWVQLHRSGDAAFDAACREAIAVAAEKLRAAPSPQPSPARGRGGKGWRYLDGAELVVRGTGGAGGGKRVQIARARLKQWTPRAEARFLAALAATCNVKAACAEAGMWAPSAYAHRKRWPAFAERWDEALEEGFARLEAGLAEAGCNLFSARERPDADSGSIPPMSIDQALHLLHIRALGARGAGGRPPRAASDAEIVRALEKRLAEMGARRRRQDGDG